MAEEAINPSQDNEDTATSDSGNESQNNTLNAREGAKTQETASRRETPQQRIERLARERAEYKEKYESLLGEKDPSVTQAPEEKLWRAKIEAKLSAPEHLKGKAEEIASYSAKYGVPIEDAITLFDSRNKVSPDDLAAQQRANSEASQSRTGGNSNPASRQETDDISKMDKKDLESEIQKRVAAGEKF